MKFNLKKIIEYLGLAKDGKKIEKQFLDETKNAANREINPPWIVFPNSSPIYGWNQGGNEHWKMNVWIPFWTALSETERESYLERWQPPNEDWKETITIYWIGKPLA